MENKKFIINTPNDHFSGMRKGVFFHKGTGETDNALRAKNLKAHWGYKVTEIDPLLLESGLDERDKDLLFDSTTKGKENPAVTKNPLKKDRKNSPK